MPELAVYGIIDTGFPATVCKAPCQPVGSWQAFNKIIGIGVDVSRYPRQKIVEIIFQLLQGLSNRLMKPFQTSFLNQILLFSVPDIYLDQIIVQAFILFAFAHKNPALLQHTYYFLIEINLKSPGIYFIFIKQVNLVAKTDQLAIDCLNTSLLRQLCFGVCDLFSPKLLADITLDVDRNKQFAQGGVASENGK